MSSADLSALRSKLVFEVGAVLPVLLITTTMAVYKPWDLTRYGRRKHDEQRTGVVAEQTERRKVL